MTMEVVSMKVMSHSCLTLGPISGNNMATAAPYTWCIKSRSTPTEYLLGVLDSRYIWRIGSGPYVIKRFIKKQQSLNTLSSYLSHSHDVTGVEHVQQRMVAYLVANLYPKYTAQEYE